jgi:hypothetical protein
MSDKGDRAGGPGEASGESFQVQDRRRIDPRTGEARPAEGEIPLPGGGVLQGHVESAAAALRPVGFEDLVQPFLLMGLSGLGVVPHPDSGRAEVDEITARLGIECLELLRARTEGNRTPDESRMLDAALYELKLQFVDVLRRDRRG